MREMESTTLSTEVQDIQKFTKNRQPKKKGGCAGDISICRWFKPGPRHSGASANWIFGKTRASSRSKNHKKKKEEVAGDISTLVGSSNLTQPTNGDV